MTKDGEYKLFLEYVNKLMERRQMVTTTYLSVNAAIVGALAFLLKDVPMPHWAYQVSALALLFAGVIACDLWRRLIIQYKTLLSWWYGQLRDLEDRMPENTKLVNREYEALYLVKIDKKRVGLTRYETRLTWIFTALYVGFGLSLLATIVSTVI